MTDIVQQMPWHCGGSSCPVGWHLASYWLRDDGQYTADRYTDGDHEEIDELPPHEEYQQAWRDYYQDVVSTGQDPLGQLIVKTTYQEPGVWQVRFARSIVGCVLQAWRRGGRGSWQHPRDLPDAVAQYLCVEPIRDGLLVFMGSIETLRQLAEDDSYVTLQRTRGMGDGVLLMKLQLAIRKTYGDVDRRVKAAAQRALAS